MSTKNSNPYKRGVYHSLFAFIQGLKRSFTESEVVDYAMTLDTHVKASLIEKYPELYGNCAVGEVVKMSKVQAKASVGVVLSPRKEGDAPAHGRGNFSAMGHLYYCELLNRKMVKDAEGNEVEEEQRYLLRFRKDVLPPWTLKYAYLTLEQQIAIESEKKESKAKRKEETEATAKVRAEKAEKRKEKKEAAEKLKAEKAEKKAKRKAEKEKEEAEKASRPKAKRGRKPKAAVPETPIQNEQDENTDIEIGSEVDHVDHVDTTETEIVEA